MVTSTITNRRIAVARPRIDAPESAYFFDPKTGLRVDLLFDFPILASQLAERASGIRIRAHRFDIASEADLLRLGRIALAARSAPGDAADIAFLERRQGQMD